MREFGGRSKGCKRLGYWFKMASNRGDESATALKNPATGSATMLPLPSKNEDVLVNAYMMEKANDFAEEDLRTEFEETTSPFAYSSDQLVPAMPLKQRAHLNGESEISVRAAQTEKNIYEVAKKLAQIGDSLACSLSKLTVHRPEGSITFQQRATVLVEEFAELGNHPFWLQTAALDSSSLLAPDSQVTSVARELALIGDRTVIQRGDVKRRPEYHAYNLFPLLVLTEVLVACTAAVLRAGGLL